MSYPEKFDTSNLHEEQQSILADFHQRRKLFDNYLDGNEIALYTCPGCGYPTLIERGGYEICNVCNWEDDNQDDKEADEIWGGPNSNLSLTENRLNIGKQLKEIASNAGGQLNTNVPQVLSILSQHDKDIRNLLASVPGDANINHPIFKKYEQEGQDLLRQLVRI
jgi:uncharacterized Zn finger protein (UPF0148 family)